MSRISFLLIHGIILLSPLAWGEGEEVHSYGNSGQSQPATSASDSPSAAASEKKGAALKKEVYEEMKTTASNIKISGGTPIDVTPYEPKQQSCADRAATAEFICREQTNPDLVRALPVIQAAMAAMAGGVNDACSKFAQAMDIANKALLAYQGGCAAAKGLCQTTCSGAKDTLEGLKKQASTACASVMEPGESTACDKASQAFTKAADLDLDANKKNSIANHYQACAGYATQLASAAVGTIGVINSMNQSKQCDKDTKAVTPTPSATPVDCTIEANKLNNQTCICKAAPRTPGCPGGLDSNLNANRADIMRGADVGSYIPGKADAASAGTDGNVGDLFAGNGGGSGSGSSAAGAPVGGRGAGIDGGGGFGGGGPQAAQKSGSGLNTNILGGEGGGGGGGRGSWGGGGGSEGKGLRDYLPGGQKDPNGKNLAGQGTGTGVTSQGGKSNWEKVRDRYRDNKPTLLGN